MVTHELVDGADVGELGLECAPVGLEDLAGSVRAHLADEDEHARTEGEDARLPVIHVCVACAVTPQRALVLDPHGREPALEVVEVDEESEDELVPRDGLAADDERQGELYAVVERHGVNAHEDRVGRLLCGWRFRPLHVACGKVELAVIGRRVVCDDFE